MFNSVTAFLSMPLLLLAAKDQLIPIPGTRYDHGLPAATELGEVVISAREMLVDITYNDGRPRKGAIAILFDPATGHYLWEFGLVIKDEKTSTMTRNYGTNARVHIAGGALVHFAYRPPFLAAHESSGKAGSLDDAEAKSLAEATAQLPAKIVGRKDDRVVVNLGQVMPQEFFMAGPGPDPSPIRGPGRIVSVSHKGNTWEFVLQGRWQQKITLDNKYRVTSAVRVN